MFEQELYDREVSKVRTQPGDLFHNYEIRNWNFTPRLYKILAISAVANVLSLLVIGSTGLLTARGCDSPFVGRVCQVLDTVYVGALIFGTESEYADVDYAKTELEDADVTFVDVTGVTPPLAYPEGYFQLANPESQFANVTDPGSGFLAPGIPANPTISGSGLINTPPIAPPVNQNPVDGDLSGSPLGPMNENPTLPRNRRNRKGGQLSNNSIAEAGTNTNSNTGANANTNPTVAEKKDEAKADENEIYINKRPLKDKAAETLAQVDAGSVKLDKSFRVVITGTLGLAKDGKTVILTNPKSAPVDKNFPADPVLTKLAEEWVVAVGDAGWYGYLALKDEKKGVGRKVTIMIEQNDATFLASVRAEQLTPERANTIASALKLAKDFGALAAKGDELTFLQSTKADSNGNFLLVNFEMPKAEVQKMIERKLAEYKEKESKPNGNAGIKTDDNSAAK